MRVASEGKTERPHSEEDAEEEKAPPFAQNIGIIINNTS
jgi:hypothetical protein